MKILEAIRTIDERLLEWLRRGDLTSDQADNLIEARADLSRLESRMIRARIMDPEEEKEIARARSESLMKILG